MIGDAYDEETQQALGWNQPGLFAPETNPLFADLQPQSGWTPVADHIEGLATLGSRRDVVLCGVANEQKYRTDPKNHFKEPCEFGLYRFASKHRLLTGSWECETEELLWIHGKHAPLLEDFLESPFHRALSVMWPDAAVFSDEWL